MKRGNKFILTVLGLAVISYSLAACGRDLKQTQETTPPGKPTATGKKQFLPPQPPPEILPVTGKVLEILDTGSFMYVSLDWKGKPVWATVPGVELKVGDVISLDHATMFKGFHSTVLNRTFDELIFASGVVGKAPRARVANNSNPRDPRNRRSARLLAGLAPVGAPAAPVSAPPSGKTAAKTGL